MTKIWSLGICMLDVIARPLEHWPEQGGLVLVDGVEFKIGGVALNAGVTVAKLGGVPVGLIGHLGMDASGDLVGQELQRLGVDTSQLPRSEHSPTGVCIVCIHPGGERSFIASLGANWEIGPSNTRLDALGVGDFLHVGGALGMVQLNGEPLMLVLQEARRRKAIVSVDTAWDGSNQWWPALAPSLPLIDIFTTNALEAERLTGSTDPAIAARKFANHGPSLVVIKLGEKGAYLLSKEFEGLIEAISVKAIDSTGAGDAFSGALLYALARGWRHQQAVIFANCVGALCVMSMGATEGVRSCTDTLAFLRAQDRAGAWDWS